MSSRLSKQIAGAKAPTTGPRPTLGRRGLIAAPDTLPPQSATELTPRAVMTMQLGGEPRLGPEFYSYIDC
jgi:hypothetical protein